MTLEERKEAYKHIEAMIGTEEEQRRKTAKMSLNERIKSNNNYNKTRYKLLEIAEKEGIKALTTVIVQCGRVSKGMTLGGKNYCWEGNSGYTERSWYCGSLWIEGMGTVFTSGRIEKVVEYLIKN